MLEKNQINNDEVSLIEVFTTLWKGKWIILIVTLIILLLGYTYSYFQKNMFNIKLPIEYGKSNYLIDFIPINDVLKQNGYFIKGAPEFSYSITPKSIAKLFQKEFNDYEEVVLTLRKIDFYQKLTKDLNEEDKNKILMDYAKSFKLKENKTEFLLDIKWGDVKEADDILKKSFKLTLENVKNSIINDLEKIGLFIDNKNQRELDKLKIALEMIEEKLPIINKLSQSNSLLTTVDNFELKEKILER